MKFTVIFAIAGVVVASNSKPRAAGCNADNCLRAIRNTARPGLSNCLDYFRTTVTPSAVTEFQTETLTITSTPTTTISVTGVTQVLLTQTIHQTASTTQLITVTVAQPAKRATTDAAQALIPTYASACSGSVRYSSACSCLGATPVTITAARPTITSKVTVSQTLNAPVQTVYSTVAVLTITALGGVTSVTDSTVTVKTTSTVTAAPVLTTSGAYQVQELNSGLFASYGSDAIVLSSVSNNWFFVSDGTVRADRNNWVAYYSASQAKGSQIYLQGVQGGLSVLRCSINNLRLDCSTNNGEFTTLVACGDSGTLYIYKASVAESDYCPGQTASKVTFNMLRQ